MTTIQTLMRIRAALPPVSTRRCTEGKRKAPGTSEAFKELTCRGIQGSRCPWTLRYYPTAQIRQGAEPNATCRVGADGETGDFKGLTLSNSGPVFLGSRGFSFRQGADRDKRHRGRSLGGERRRRRSRRYERHLPADEIGRQRGQSVILAFCPAVLDRHVVTFDKPGLIQAFVECCQEMRKSFARPTIEKPDHRLCRLLRARCERPPRPPSVSDSARRRPVPVRLSCLDLFHRLITLQKFFVSHLS